MSKKQTKIPMVKIIFKSSNKARQSVFGATKSFGGRPFSYGWRKPGDVFNVAEADVIARLDMFNAYPCDEPFTTDRGKLINPCGKMESVEKVGGTLEDIPGVGPRMAEKLIDVGLETQDDVLKKLTPDLMKELKVPPKSRTAITEWQESQLP